MEESVEDVSDEEEDGLPKKQEDSNRGRHMGTMYYSSSLLLKNGSVQLDRTVQLERQRQPIGGCNPRATPPNSE